MITNTKPYVLVAALSINDKTKFLENIKQGFKRAISWNKYRPEITTQKKAITQIIWLLQHLEILINCLLFNSKMAMVIPEVFIWWVLYMLLVEIKDFNALISNKSFFDQQIKSKLEAYEKLAEMLKTMVMQHKIY